MHNRFSSVAYIKQGEAAEQLLDGLFSLTGFSAAAPELTKERLLETAMRVDPRRYHAVSQHHKLARCSRDEILDYLYGVDHLIDVGEGLYVSVDTTANPNAVATKVSKAQSYSKLRAAVGIHQHFVVFVVGIITRPSAYVMADSINRFHDEMVEALNGPANRVRHFRLHVS